MNKKKLAKTIWNGTKIGAGFGFGLCTDAAVTFAMFKGMPVGMHPVLQRGYQVGSVGTGMLAGSLTTELAIGQMNNIEEQYKKRWEKAKKQANNSHKKKVKHEKVEQIEHRTEKENGEIIAMKMDELKKKKAKEKEEATEK